MSRHIVSIFYCLILLWRTWSLDLMLDPQWKQWKAMHGKQYLNLAEETQRFHVWKENLATIGEHNNGNKGFKLAMNHLGDLTQEEFHQKYLSSISEKELEQVHTRGEVHVDRNITMPSSLDWREKGWVTQVKDQGVCGSSWAFAAVGALEAQHKRTSGELVEMSPQQLIDCSWKYGNRGCSGGHATYAYEYIASCSGICSKKSYPYLAYVWHCTASYCSKVTSNLGYYDISSGSESSLQNAVYSIGPISVVIDASTYTYQFYSGGIFYDDSCSNNKLNHEMLVVGFGSYNGVSYWIGKNSWGTSWGESGYIRMIRDGSNMCGIATAASYPKMKYM